MGKKKKWTAREIVVKRLTQKSIPSDESIIKEVLSKVEATGFNKAQLSWYKCELRKGNITGKKVNIPFASRGPKKTKKNKGKNKK